MDTQKLEKLLQEQDWYVDIGVAEYRLGSDENGYHIVNDEGSKSHYETLGEALIVLFDLIGAFINKEN